MTIAPLLVGLLLARVVLAVWTARAGERQSEPTQVGPGSGRLARLARFVVVWVLVGPACGWLALSEPRTLVTYVPGMVFLVTVALWPVARFVLVPLGLVRAAYHVAYVSFRAKEERAGAALLAASLAFHRKADFDAETAEWLEEKIQAQTGLRGAAIAAAAAMAAARGDKEGARALFESARTLDVSVCPSVARHTAASWLAADAAARGAWGEVIEIAGDPAGAGRSAKLLAGVARRLTGGLAAPGRAELLWLWATAPGWLGTFAIVERALSVPDGEAPLDDDDDEDVVAPRAPDGDLLARALSAHVVLLSSKKVKPADVARVGRAFDAAFEDAALGVEVDERAALLGATRAGAVLGRLRADVETSLFELLKSHHIALDDTVDELGDVAARAQRRLRDETLTVIEALSDAVRNRVNERRALSAIDEWREWSALRIAYQRGVTLGGPELRYLAFTKVHSDVCALAVWLFNERKEKAIANAMFRFLLDEATATGDQDAIALQTKNVGCGV